MILGIWTALAFAASLSAAGENTCRDGMIDPVQLYGTDQLTFDVVRKGKTIGQQAMTFEWTDNGLRVVADMAIKVKFLVFTAYKFTYQSEALWCGNQLLSLESRTNDNGDETVVTAEYGQDGLVVARNGEPYATARMAYPTNHWNPGVLEEEIVLNTITGRLNNVQIEKRGESPVVGTENTVIPATEYVYTGELSSHVWYDAEGRWLKLVFEGSDGSQIEYVPHFLDTLIERKAENERTAP